MRVAIIHHHLRRGGVTRVIEHTAQELVRRGHQVVILSGEPVADEGMLSGVDIRVVADLGYSESGASPSTEALLQSLSEQSKASLGAVPDVWHFHNHSLGKNPAYSLLPALLAQLGAALLLHLHDFAEDGRPANYARLNGVHDRLYPCCERICYAVLNNRDAEALRIAGVPDKQIRLVPNPVVAPSGSPDDPPSGDADLLLYPARGIRRKNIGELVLLAVVLAGRYRLALTLPPENPIERQPYEVWVEFASQHQIAVELAAGVKHNGKLGEFLQQCRAVVTTSIKEGFGLGFLEPWLANRAVIGRDIDYVTADFSEHQIELSGLYRQLTVPLAVAGGDELLKDQQLAALSESYAAYGREVSKDDCRLAFAAAVAEDGCVDFGKLSAAMQRAVIVAALQSGELRRGIATVFDGAGIPGSEQIRHNAVRVAEKYSLAAHVNVLENCYDLLTATESSEVELLDPQRVLDAFLNPENLHLLMH